MNPTMKAYITGVSGTGKTTIANALKERGVDTYSLDEVPGLCHWVGRVDGRIVDYEAKLDREFIESHAWACDIRQLRRLLEGKGDTAVFGHVENQGDFLDLFDKVLLLQCRPETFLKRIMGRGDNPFGKDASAQEFLLSTYQRFEADMLGRGAESLDAEKPLDEVVESVMEKIGRIAQ